MPSSPSLIPSYALALTIGLVYKSTTSSAATTRAAPTPTTGAVVHGGAAHQHPYGEGVSTAAARCPVILTPHHHRVAPQNQQLMVPARALILRASTSSNSQLTMAPRIPLTGSITASSSSTGSTPSPRIAPGSRHIILPVRPRRGTTPSSRMRVCLPRNASRSCAICVLGRRFMAPVCLTLLACPSSRRCRTTLITSTRCSTMPGISPLLTRPNCLWAGLPEHIKADVELQEPQDL
jgi:hypothetical protein